MNTHQLQHQLLELIYTHQTLTQKQLLIAGQRLLDPTRPLSEYEMILNELEQTGEIAKEETEKTVVNYVLTTEGIKRLKTTNCLDEKIVNQVD